LCTQGCSKAVTLFGTVPGHDDVPP